jgi:hypothetical protein
VQIEYRHGLGNPDNVRKYAAELAALTPDVILSRGEPGGAAVAGDPHRADRVHICC